MSSKIVDEASEQEDIQEEGEEYTDDEEEREEEDTRECTPNASAVMCKLLCPLFNQITA
jgi:hypothetical protein